MTQIKHFIFLNKQKVLNISMIILLSPAKTLDYEESKIDI